jgi:hypothetical protein
MRSVLRDKACDAIINLKIMNMKNTLTSCCGLVAGVALGLGLTNSAKASFDSDILSVSIPASPVTQLEAILISGGLTSNPGQFFAAGFDNFSNTSWMNVTATPAFIVATGNAGGTLSFAINLQGNSYADFSVGTTADGWAYAGRQPCSGSK